MVCAASSFGRTDCCRGNRLIGTHFREHDFLHDPVFIYEDMGWEVVDRIGRTRERSIRVEQDIERHAVQFAKFRASEGVSPRLTASSVKPSGRQLFVGRLNVRHLGATGRAPCTPEVQPDWLPAEIAEMDDLALRANRDEIGGFITNFGEERRIDSPLANIAETGTASNEPSENAGYPQQCPNRSTLVCCVQRVWMIGSSRRVFVVAHWSVN